MFPIEHFIVAVVPVIAYVLVRDRRPPPLRLLGIVFVGSQLSDLIDKPLAHQFQLLPSGRLFVHSLPFAIPIACLVGWYAWRTDRPRAGRSCSHTAPISSRTIGARCRHPTRRCLPTYCGRFDRLHRGRPYRGGPVRSRSMFASGPCSPSSS